MLESKRTVDPLNSLFTPRKYGQPTPAAPMPQKPMAPQAPMQSVLKKGDMAGLMRDIKPPHPFEMTPMEQLELRMRKRGMIPDPEPDLLPENAVVEEPVVEGPLLPPVSPSGEPRRFDGPRGLFDEGPQPPMQEQNEGYNGPIDPSATWMVFKKPRQPMPSLDGYQPGLQGLLG